jgi:hypothetical protein
MGKLFYEFAAMQMLMFCGYYANARMSMIAIVRATHLLCMRGSRVPPSQMSNRRPH